MTDEKTFKTWKGLCHIENMVCSSASNTVVFESKSDQSSFVGESLGKLKHKVVIEIVVVQKKFFEGLVSNESFGDSFKTKITNKITL